MADANPLEEADNFALHVAAVESRKAVAAEARPCNRAARISRVLPVRPEAAADRPSKLVEVSALGMARRKAMASCVAALLLTCGGRVRGMERRTSV